MTNVSNPAYLKGKHAIVTGGGKGIGAAIATELARLGAKLTLMGRTRATLDQHASRLSAEFGGEICVLECDVADEHSVDRAFRGAMDRFGMPYILVNNAGQAEAADFVSTPRAVWDKLMAVNATSTFLCMQKVLPAMIEAKTGRVVNIASTAGLKGYTKISAYCASKHAVIGLTKSVAMETAKMGITVNAVCPGYTDETDMTFAGIRNVAKKLGKSEDEARQILVRATPRGVLTTPLEVANAVAWLCSPGAGAITGQAIAVAGGEVM